jgi:WD40 repeat protein
VAWFPDSKRLAYSMGGSIWVYDMATGEAAELPRGNGYDYQPDVSPDGKRIVFARYTGSAIELYLYTSENNTVLPLTQNKGVNVEPRFSPDGQWIAFVSTMSTGHFLLYRARVTATGLDGIECLTPDRKTDQKRYYYSAFDHSVNPVWSRSGKEIYFVNNHDVPHGSGNLVRMDIDTKDVSVIHREETSWKMRPDFSPDGTRMVYSSYLGSPWQQLWLLPAGGGYGVPLTYGEYDNVSPRWSPDGTRIAFISNRDGNTSLWLIDPLDGGQKEVKAAKKVFSRTMSPLRIRIQAEDGTPMPARVSIRGSDGLSYAPEGAWVHADDSYFPSVSPYEPVYFHSQGTDEVLVPDGEVSVTVSRGPLYEISKITADARQTAPVTVTLKRLSLPADFGTWQSADLHVHMNYTGNYSNTPERLIGQAKAEDLNYVFNLIVNKEQRIPDVSYFSAQPDPASTPQTMVLHGQEFHTSFWGHLGLLNLNDHLILPDYSAYPQTAVSSHFPNNTFIIDRAHEQNALAGYVHPYEIPEIFPDQSPNITHSLPVDAALGKVDYVEIMGFSDHRATELVWHHLLNCGIRIAAGAGTDAMANYASLRGPVGLNRVFVKAAGAVDRERFTEEFKSGRSFVSNGPIIGFKVDGHEPGDSIQINPKGQTLSYTAFLRSNVPVDHFEVLWNGKPIATHSLGGERKSLDASGKIKVKGPGWLLLHAWADKPDPDLTDIYAYASTNPIFAGSGRARMRSRESAEYLLRWVKRVEGFASGLNTWRSAEEQKRVLADIRSAQQFYAEISLR